MSAMRSKLAAAAKKSLVAQSQRLTRAERLEAFLVHSRLMAELHRAGQEHRSKSASQPRE
jgi:hypothetical protein